MNNIIKNIIENYKKNKLCYIALFVTFIIISLSFLNLKSFQIGGDISHDVKYHMMRIQTLALEMKDGNIPFYNSAYRFFGYGAVDFLYYPYLFLYIPSLLYIWTNNIYISFNIFMILLNLLAIISMYKSAKLIFNDVKIATIAAIVFCMNYMFLWNMHLRIAIGESIAVVFMPMVVAGLYSIIFTEEKKYHYFIIGLTGMAQSHILTVAYFSILILAVIIIFFMHIIKNKATITAFVKSITWLILLNVGFYYPFIVTYFTEKNVLMPAPSNLARYEGYRNLLSVFAKIPLLTGLKSIEKSYETIGRFSLLELALLAIALVFFILIYIMKKDDRYTKIGSAFMFITIVYIVISIVSYQIAENNVVMSKIILEQQFPMRYFIRMIPFMSLAIAYSYVKIGLIADRFAFVLIMLFTLSGRYMINFNLFDENLKIRDEQYIPVDNLINAFNDYAVAYDTAIIEYPDELVKIIDGKVKMSKNISIENEEKGDLSYACDFKKEKDEEGFIELPFHNFNNFICVINGKKIDIVKEDKKLIYVNITNDLTEGHLEVYYKVPGMYLYTFYVSILSSLVFIITMIYGPIGQIYTKCKEYIQK